MLNGKFNPILSDEKNGTEVSDGEINGEINTLGGKIKSPGGEINGEIKSPGGEINGEIKIYQAVVATPGIKREALLLTSKIPLRTIDRILKRLKESGKIEYRGSKKTGGWYVKT